MGPAEDPLRQEDLSGDLDVRRLALVASQRTTLYISIYKKRAFRALLIGSIHFCPRERGHYRVSRRDDVRVFCDDERLFPALRRRQ